MQIQEEHKRLLLGIGLREEDFQLFDGRWVTYEFNEEKGVRLFDPYYRTSYGEYIGVDGWSAWSSETDTFMSDVFKSAKTEAERREKISQRPTQEEYTRAMEKKFGKKDS